MQFVSTRGEAPVLGFCAAVLSGLARAGGLYLPESWPQIAPDEIAGFTGHRRKGRLVKLVVALVVVAVVAVVVAAFVSQSQGSG